MITDDPVRGRFAYLDHPGLMGLSGLEQMRRFRRKEIPYGPFWYLTGLDVVDVSMGTSTWRLPVTDWLLSGAGVIPGGVLALVADGALGSALYSTFPPGAFLATSELSMHFLRPPGEGCGAIIGRASLIQSGRTQGLTEASIEDSDGRLLAHATARNLILRLPETPAPLADGAIPWPRYDGPHPFQRPAEGEIVPQDVWDRMDGLEMLKAWERGELPMAPLGVLMGFALEEAGEGTFTCAIPASQWFCTAGGTFFGGIVALVADNAMNGALQSTLPAGSSWGTLDLKVNFVRPVQPDGRPLVARGRVVHRGRTIGVMTSEVVSADGKTVALANASAMIFPGRPWRPGRAPVPIDEPSQEHADG